MSDDQERLIGPRQGRILTAVVQEFIRHGEPVGSKHLVGRYRLTVSSATVRNDMSRLEDLGYLAQPHTSAGRIPTDLGYRFYVDGVRLPVTLAPEGERAVDDGLAHSRSGIEDLLEKATEVLSRLTSQASAVLAPTITAARLRHLDIVRLAPRLVLVVIITDTGQVEKTAVELAADASQEDLDAALSQLHEAVSDLRLDDAERAATNAARTAPVRTKPVIEAAAEAIGDAVRKDTRVFVGGAANLAAGTFGAVENLRRVFEALESQHAVSRVLAEHADRPVSVAIGSELTEPDLQSCSVVVAGYRVGDGMVGSVGVIGPTRMDYEQAMAITQAVARAIGEQLGALGG